MNHILALDLGTTWGWATASDRRILRSGTEQLPDASLPYGERFAAFQAWLRGRVGDVDAILYEQPFGRYTRVLQLQFGMATVVELECEHAGLEYSSVQPSAMKKFATGSGNASKDDMRAALFDRYDEFGLEEPDEDIGQDEVDAVWLALYTLDELTV